jgi:hypothetical protein
MAQQKITMKSKSGIAFDTFWKKYPLHMAKANAEREWNRLSARDQRDAFNGIDRYREHCLRTGVAFKYANGWLADRRWTDEYDEPARPSAPQQEIPGDMEIW